MSSTALRNLTIATVLLACWMSAAAVKVLTSPFTWLYVGACFLALGVLWLALWHHHKMLSLRAAWLVTESWIRVPPWAHREVWVCPFCASPMFSWELVMLHQDAATSPCAAAHAQRLEVEKAAASPALPVTAGGAGTVDTFSEEGAA